jgi:hypothetical protein
MAQAIEDLSRMVSSQAPDSAPGSAPSWAVGLEDAGNSYQEFRRRLPTAEAEDLDRWCAAFPGNPAHAQLFRDLHSHDPAAAARLAEALTAMPRVGVKVAGFVLVAELGRGAFGRVFQLGVLALSDPNGPDATDPTGDPAGGSGTGDGSSSTWSGTDQSAVPPQDASSDPYTTVYTDPSGGTAPNSQPQPTYYHDPYA